VGERRASGLRLLLALAAWLVLLAAALGTTLAAFLLLAPGWLRTHRADAGAAALVEAYLALLAALLVAFGGPSGVRDRLGFRFTSAADVGLALGAWLGSLGLGAVATAAATPLLGPSRSNAVEVLSLSRDPLFVGLVVPTVALLAPACEELLFRGALFGWLRGRLPLALAVPLSAAAFAGAHLLPPLLPYLFVFGVFAALVYQRTGSTLNSFVMHASQNTLAVVLAYAALSRP
jgi:membrane protease YdiL (CAAX protease family)